MNDWWWDTICDFYQRVASAAHRDPSEPPPDLFAHGMLALIERVRVDSELGTIKPGLHRRALTLKPHGTERKIMVRWIATDLYEIELEAGGILLDMPWDGKIVVPADVVLQALINCKQRLEGEHPPHHNGHGHQQSAGDG